MHYSGRERERKSGKSTKKKKKSFLSRLTAPLKQLFDGQRRGNRELALILTTRFEVRSIVTKRFADQTNTSFAQNASLHLQRISVHFETA